MEAYSNGFADKKGNQPKHLRMLVILAEDPKWEPSPASHDNLAFRLRAQQKYKAIGLLLKKEVTFSSGQELVWWIKEKESWLSFRPGYWEDWPASKRTFFTARFRERVTDPATGRTTGLGLLTHEQVEEILQITTIRRLCDR